MKRVLGTFVILVLMTLTPSAFAISGYQLGFQDGLSDAKCSIQDICHYYVIQPGKGFRFDTHDFINGYVNGFCSIAMPPTDQMSDAMQKNQCIHVIRV